MTGVQTCALPIWEARKHDSGDRPSVAERSPEIGARRSGEKARVLLDERAVEAERFAKPLAIRARRALSEHDLDGVAGQQVNEKEHQRGDAEERRQREEQAACGGSHVP